MSESGFLVMDWISGGEFVGGQRQALWCRVQGKNHLELNCVSHIHSGPGPSYMVASLLQIQISLVATCSLISLNAMIQLVSCDVGA